LFPAFSVTSYLATELIYWSLHKLKCLTRIQPKLKRQVPYQHYHYLIKVCTVQINFRQFLNSHLQVNSCRFAGTICIQSFIYSSDLRPIHSNHSDTIDQCFSNFVSPRPGKFFFLRRGPSPNKYTRKYLSLFFKVIH